MTISAMNWADYTIAGILGLSVLMGLWRGFIGEVMALVCWALAVWVSWMFGADLAERFSTTIVVPSMRLMLGYALCFITVLIAGAIVSFLLRKLVESSGLSSSDRLLGMVFGLMRGLVLVTLVVLLLGFTPFPRDPWWQQSRLLPSFESGARWLSTRLPPEVARYLESATLLAPALPSSLPAKPAPQPHSPLQ